LKQCAISHFETGRRAPSLDNLKRLADALEVTTDYLIGRTQPAKTSAAVLRNQQKLSSKDVKFLERLADDLIRRKNR
jgi:transcriptional regulator with XRE-family HTH domain